MPSTEATLSGNITDAPELKYTSGGAAVASFTVACNHSWKNNNDEWEKQVSYIDVTAWRELAEYSAAVLEKGIGVVVAGRLEQQSWDDKETGKKRSKIVLIADSVAVNVRSIESISRRKFDENGKAKPKQAAPSRRSTPDEDPF